MARPADTSVERFELAYAATARTAIWMGAGALRGLPEVLDPQVGKVALIGDERVLDLFADGLLESLRRLPVESRAFSFPAGEQSKNRETKARIEDAMLEWGMTRGDCVLAVGGGVSLDLAGFVAATYMRGLTSVYVPTTLLAQVDAALGGKTGVNTPQGKNLIGAFHQPRAVLIDPQLTDSLPALEWRNGLAELVKHAFIDDAGEFDDLGLDAENLAAPASLGAARLRRSLEIKAGIVCRDEREGGRRAILNFGHTIGHAIEKASDHAVPHGVAVALGMNVEAAIAWRRGWLPEAHYEQLRALWPRLGFAPFPFMAFELAEPFLTLDKKNRAGQVCMVLPKRIGEMAGAGSSWTHPVALDEIREAYDGSLR